MNVARMKMPVGMGVAVWLAAFLSPSACFLLILLASKSQTVMLPGPEAVVALFLLVVAGALVVCEWVAWSCSRTVGWRIGWMVFTVVAVGLQFAVILVILRMILVAMIS